MKMSATRARLHNSADKTGWRLRSHNPQGDVWERDGHRITVDYTDTHRISGAWVSTPAHLNPVTGRFMDCIDADGKSKDRQIMRWMSDHLQ